MTLGWYFRFSIVLILVVLAGFAVWPSVEAWAPAPPWVKRFVHTRISPGLDIRGGLRLMYEVEVDEAIRDLRDTRAEQLVDQLGRAFKIIPKDANPTQEQLQKVRQRVRIERPSDNERAIRLTFQKPGDVSALSRDVINNFGDLREVSRKGTVIELSIRDDYLERIREDAVQQAVKTISLRIDELQVRETSISSREEDIIIEIPGADEEMFERMRKIIGQTARLEFKIADDDTDFVAQLTDVPEGISKQTEGVSAGSRDTTTTYLVAKGWDGRAKLNSYIQRLEAQGRVPDDRQLALGELERNDDGPAGRATKQEPEWRTYYLFSRSQIGGDLIEDAYVGEDPETRQPVVQLTFKRPRGADQFEELTGRNVKRRMAIVLDDRVESAPVIQGKIPGGRCQITLGGFYKDKTLLLQEARDLVVVLKAGALPAPIRPSNEQLIGPTLGRDAVQKGAQGALVGIALVLLFMLLYYQVAGIVADLAVMMNLVFLLAILAAFEATLTLPGIAGIALTVGMAVDANVLINERIREELRTGKSARAAVDQGFKRAFWSIFDSQVTTFIAGVVLYQFGTGPIKGFAVTLMWGILTSLFTGVFCSRVMFDWLVRGLKVNRLRVG